MSYRYYPVIVDKIYTAYTNGQLFVDMAFVMYSNANVTLANATIINVSKTTGTNYIDLTIDVRFQFNSSGGTLTQANVTITFPYFTGDEEYLDFCTNPGVTVGAGSVTLNQRYIIRFYTTS